MKEDLHDFLKSTKIDGLREPVQGHLSAIAEGEELPHEGMWLAFKHIICQIPDDVYIVLDGLDECDKESIDFLTTKFDSTLKECQKLRILIVSRHLNIRSNLIIDLHKHTQAIERDLLWYIYQRATEYGLDRKEYKSSELYEQYQSGELKQLHQTGKLCNILLDRADKTYLWVALVMDMLNRDEVEEVLKSENAVDKF